MWPAQRRFSVLSRTLNGQTGCHVSRQQPATSGQQWLSDDLMRSGSGSCLEIGRPPPDHLAEWRAFFLTFSASPKMRCNTALLITVASRYKYGDGGCEVLPVSV